MTATVGTLLAVLALTSPWDGGGAKAEPVWVYGIGFPVPCAGTCPQWTLFRASGPAMSDWQRRSPDCADLYAEYVPAENAAPNPLRSALETAEEAWLLPEPLDAVPDDLLDRNVWRLRVKPMDAPEKLPWELGVPGGPGDPAYDQAAAEARKYAFLQVLEAEVVHPVRMCRAGRDDAFTSPRARGSLVVDGEPESGKPFWVVIAGADASFVEDLVWIVAPESESGKVDVDVTWNAAGDEATLRVEGTPRLRVSWRTRRSELVAMHPDERKALAGLERLHLRERGWSLRVVEPPATSRR